MKPRGNGEGSVRQRKDGTWEGIFSAGYDPGTGKRIRKSVYGKTQGEVIKKLREACRAIDEGTYSEPTKLTVGTWLDIWLKDWIGNVKQHSTAKSYEMHVRVNLKPAIGAIKLVSLSPLHIQGMYKVLLAGTDKRSALSPKTIVNLNGVLHKALDQARRLGYIKTNPCDSVTLPRVEKPDIKPLDEKHMPQFLAACQGDPFALVYAVDMFTGMRLSEILGLTWDRVNFENGTLRVDRQLILEKSAGRTRGYRYSFAPLKNDKERTITPAPQVMDFLRERRRIQREDRFRAGINWCAEKGLNDLVFTNDRGKHITHSTVYRHFKKIVAEIGLPERRFHDLRHTYAVASIRAGDDIKTVSTNLGHATISITLDVYGHVTDQMHADSSARMGRYIESLKKPL